MVATPEQSANLICSFCGKSQDQVRRLIAGPTVFICDKCAVLAVQLSSEGGGLNLRAAYFSFEFVAKVLYPVAWLLEQLHVARKSN
jgi:hypothetical protein